MNNSIKNSRFGITVADLKEVIKDRPETDETGEPYEVWIRDSDGLNHKAVEIEPYNRRTLNDRESDIIISAEY